MKAWPGDLFLRWREWDGRDANFIGPVEPPMVRWLRLGSPKSAWEIEAEARVASRIAQPGAQMSFDFENAA